MRIGSIQKFKYILIKFLRTNKNSVFRVSAIHDTKLCTGLWLNFSHVNELKCRHNLNHYTINPIFGHAGTWLDQKIKINFEIFDVTDWTANNYNSHFTIYSKQFTYCPISQEHRDNQVIRLVI